MNILAIGSHHDDVEFGCFGTLSKHKENGDNVYVVIMSNGLLRHTVTNKIIREVETTTNETKCAMKVLGIDWFQLNFQDTEVPFNVESISKIERLIDKLSIDTVYTHWAGDTHQDHINTLKSTLSACRGVDNVLCYEQVPLPRVTNVYPVANYYVDITGKHFDKKIEASKCHKSQIKKYNDVGYDVIDGLEVMARYRGNQCGVKHAEAFDVLKMKW